MINAEEFVEKLVSDGYSHICAVPCSFAKGLINASINNKDIEYVGCANEGVAGSIASGIILSGGKALVIIQSSGITNISSCLSSMVSPFEVKLPVLTSWRPYKEGASEIQHKILAENLPNFVSACGLELKPIPETSITEAVESISDGGIFSFNKSTFSFVELDSPPVNSYEPRNKFLEVLKEHPNTSNAKYISTTGYMSREVYNFSKEMDNYYQVGNMGNALSIGLGASILNDRVVVLGGDAEFAMHMGGMLTAGRYNTSLLYILFDNESNRSTGGQDTQQTHVDYKQIATASGFEVESETIVSPSMLKEFLNTLSSTPGEKQKFVYIKCGPSESDTTLGRPTLEYLLNANRTSLFRDD